MKNLIKKIFTKELTFVEIFLWLQLHYWAMTNSPDIWKSVLAIVIVVGGTPLLRGLLELGWRMKNEK